MVIMQAPTTLPRSCKGNKHGGLQSALASVQGAKLAPEASIGRAVPHTCAAQSGAHRLSTGSSVKAVAFQSCGSMH